MAELAYNPLESIELPDLGVVPATGLIVVVGPNSSGKTLLLRDVIQLVRGAPEKSIVCKSLRLRPPDSAQAFLTELVNLGYATVAGDTINFQSHLHGSGGQSSVNLKQTDYETAVRNFTDAIKFGRPPHLSFLGTFGVALYTDLTLGHRLQTITEKDLFDTAGARPQNDLQALYLDLEAQETLAAETGRVVGNAAWIDNTRGDSKLRLRASQSPSLPSPEIMRDPKKVAGYFPIEKEGEGYKSYVAIVMSLLIGRKPICLIDEPELYLH